MLASNKASLFFYGIYVFTQYINIVSIGQELMCSIEFQSFLSLLDLIVYSKAVVIEHLPLLDLSE
jgi:hypothetical protein